MRVLVDSSVLIDFLRVKDKQTTNFFSLVSNNHQLYTSVIVHTELFAGRSVWESKRAFSELSDLFSGIKILPLTEEISQKAGEIKTRFDLDIIDAIIASTALLTNLDLATLNIKDFKKVPGLKLLDK